MKKICIIPLVLCTLHFLSCSTGVEEDQNKSGSNAAIEEQSFITYSFYSDNSSSQAWITISGKTGEPVPHVSVPKKTNYRFNEWKSADGKAVPYIFGEQDLLFYAEWELLEGINRGNLLGSKTTPDALYDLVFSDGSAMPYPDQLDSLTSEQINNVVAMIYTTTYNPNTGSNTTGNFKLGAGFFQKDLKWCSKSYKDNHGLGQARVLVYNLMYTGYVFEDTDNDPTKTHAIKSLNSNYGLANYYDSPMFEQYVDFEFAPAFYYATNYGYYKNIVEVYRKKWYLPSIEEIRALFKNEEARQKYMQLSLKVTSVLLDNVSIWTNSTDDKQTPIEVNSGAWYSNQSGNGRNLNFDDKCIVRFPGELNRIKINVKDKDLGAGPGTNVHRYDIYYLFYSKAYCIDYKGNQGLKEKDEGACVIPIRIF